MRTCRPMIAWLVALAAPAFSMNGTTPVWKPTTITIPGHYVLTRDIVGPSDVDVIVIESDGVVLDLNGFSIIASGVAVGVRLDIVGIVTPTMIDIRNGIIKGGDSGIAGGASSSLPAVMDALEIVTPTMDCVDLTNVSLKIVGSGIHGCGGDGVHIVSVVGGVVEVVDTKIAEVQGNGLFVSGHVSAVIRESVVTSFGLAGADSAGIRAVDLGDAGLVVMGTTVAGGGANGSGLILELAGIVTPAMIHGNQITGNGLHGVDIREGRADLAGNTIAGNGGDGVRVSGDFVLVESSDLTGNTGAGLRFLNGNGHAYRNLFTRDNTASQVDDQFGNTDGGGNIQ